MAGGITATRRRFFGGPRLSGAPKGDRVPQTLQTVLTVANRGKEVTKAPPGRVASRTFRSWFGGSRNASHNVSRKTVSDTSTADDSSGVTSICSAIPSKGPIGIPEVVSISPETSRRKAIPEAAPVTKYHVSPQVYLTSLLKNRGYSSDSFKSTETSYYNKPTPLQVASHGVRVVDTIRKKDAGALRELMELGLSPNACNEHGESIVHTVCRTGVHECMQVLLDHGCTVQVADDYGRTPLHDACWSTETNFELVDLILAQDPRLLCVADARGALPLTYLREEQWTAWTKYLMSRKDVYWPERCIAKLGVEALPALATAGPNTKPIPDPTDSLSLELAKMVAQGRMSPMEAAFLKDDCDSSDDEDSCSDSDSDSDSECSSDEDEDDESESESSEEDEDDWSESAFDENEMEEILGCLGKGQVIAWSS